MSSENSNSDKNNSDENSTKINSLNQYTDATLEEAMEKFDSAKIDPELLMALQANPDFLKCQNIANFNKNQDNDSDDDLADEANSVEANRNSSSGEEQFAANNDDEGYAADVEDDDEDEDELEDDEEGDPDMPSKYFNNPYMDPPNMNQPKSNNVPIGPMPPGMPFENLQEYYLHQQQLLNNQPKHIIDDIEGKSEDEGINDYKQGGYHPVYVGEVLIDRYVVIQKLGWGHFSTVWLAKDFLYNTFVAIKVQKSASHYLEAAYDEVELLQKAAKHSMDKKWLTRLKQHYKKEKRKNFTREDCHVVQLLNAFIYKGPYGNHFSMVFEILGVNLLEIIKRYDYKGVPMNLCRKIAKQVLIGLDYLHTACKIIHTDLKPENVMICLSQKEIEDICENGQLSSSKKHEVKIKEYENMYGFKNLRRIIVEFKRDFEEELKINKDEENSQAAIEVEVDSDDDDKFYGKAVSTHNRHYSADKDLELARIEEEDEKENYDQNRMRNLRHTKTDEKQQKLDSKMNALKRKKTAPAPAVPQKVFTADNFDVEAEFKKICETSDAPINKFDKKRIKKNLKRKLKKLQKREKNTKGGDETDDDAQTGMVDESQIQTPVKKSIEHVPEEDMDSEGRTPCDPNKNKRKEYDEAQKMKKKQKDNAKQPLSPN